MLKPFLTIALSSLIGTMLFCQEWQDCTLPSDTITFHKLCKVGSDYWAIDYGNGKVFKSDDNAQNWNLLYQTEGEYLEAIQFLDKENGYLSGDYGIIMKTTDGGKTWKEIGPAYDHRVTKKNALEGDPKALNKNYYKLYFKNKKEGLVWGFEMIAGDYKSFAPFFLSTVDAGESWKKIDYDRKEKGAEQKIITDFLHGHSWKGKALEIYSHGTTVYDLGNKSLNLYEHSALHKKINSFPLPPLPEKRRMLRTVHFISDHQGYIFGGDLKDKSSGYILETLDGGRSWKLMQTELPHIHYSLQQGNEILLAGKDGFLKKWTIEEKPRQSFVHYGSTEKIMIDGQVLRGEWEGANKTEINNGIDLYTIQDDHYLYASVQYDTTQYANYYCDLFIQLAGDTLLNLHASQQLGERTLTGNEWTDSEPPFEWGYISRWTANTIKFDRKKKSYLPYTAIEFQISKSKLPEDNFNLSLQTRDINWEKEHIEFPITENKSDKTAWLEMQID